MESILYSIPVSLDSPMEVPSTGVAHPSRHDPLLVSVDTTTGAPCIFKCARLPTPEFSLFFPSFEPSSYFHISISSREKKNPSSPHPLWVIPSGEIILTIGVFHFLGGGRLLRGVVGV